MPRPKTNLRPIIRDAAFAKRLLTACEQSDKIPDFGQGQQSFLRDELKVSAEGVRRWFSGEARPRPDKMRQLAKLLEVDEAWLSLGIAPESDPKERKARNAVADGAVNVVAGVIQMNGGHPAFPADTDPRAAYVDLYTIIRGAQYAIHVSLGQEVGPGQFRFRIPHQYAECVVIGVVQTAPVRMVLLNIKADLIDRHKTRRGGYVEVTVEKVDQDYKVGADRVPRITSFADRL